MNRLLFTLLLVGGLAGMTSANLKAEYLGVRLKSANYCQAPFYDGGNLIYLFGGCGFSSTTILVFSLSSEILEYTGGIGEGANGSVQKDSQGNLLFFGGGSDGDQVLKFTPSKNSTTFVGTLPLDVRGSSSFKYNDTVVILGGPQMLGSILTFDVKTLNVSVAGRIPPEVNLHTINRIGNKAYGFDLIKQRALQLDLETLQFVEVGPKTLPVFSNRPTSVIVNGTFIYLIGGYRQAGKEVGDIIQFNTKTYESKFIPLSNLELEDTGMFTTGPASVYVPNRNRIYCFGGNDIFTAHDGIFYVDLNPLDLNPIVPNSANDNKNFGYMVTLTAYIALLSFNVCR